MSDRAVATQALATALVALALVLLVLVWARHDLAVQGHRVDGVRACVANNAYPRALLGQCLDDYADMVAGLPR